MKRILCAASLALFASASFSNPPATEASDRLTNIETRLEVSSSETESDKNVARNCIRHTGSRIIRRDRDGCLAVAGRSYSRDDLELTGARSTAEALEMLDPAIRSGR